MDNLDTKPRLYANAFNALFSPCDMIIRLFRTNPVIEGLGDVSSLGVDEIGEVTMSIPLAKNLAKVLTENIEGYEAKYGQVVDLSNLNDGTT